MSQENNIIQKIPNETIFPIHQIPKIIGEYVLTADDLDNLSKGEKIYAKDVKAPDGIYKDASIFLYRNAEKEICVATDFKQEVLEIPRVIYGKPLTEEEISLLNQRKTIPIELPTGEKLFLAIDDNLNKITVSTPKQIQLLHEIGGYQLSEEEKLKFINGEKLAPKLLKGKNGYYTAEISLSKDKKGIVFENYTTVENKKEIIDELRATLNMNHKINNDILNNVIQTETKAVTDQNESISNIKERYYIFEFDDDKFKIATQKEIDLSIQQEEIRLKDLSEKINGMDNKNIHYENYNKEITQQKFLLDTIISSPKTELTPEQVNSFLNSIDNNKNKSVIIFNQEQKEILKELIHPLSSLDKIEVRFLDLQTAKSQNIYADKEYFNALKAGRLDLVNSLHEQGKKLSTEGVKSIDDAKEIKDNHKDAAKSILGMKEDPKISKILKNNLQESLGKIKKAGMEKLM